MVTDTHTPRIYECGTCGRCWDDAIVTSMTPTPSARCPFEYFHNESVPDDWPVRPIGPRFALSRGMFQ